MWIEFQYLNDVRVCDQTAQRGTKCGVNYPAFSNSTRSKMPSQHVLPCRKLIKQRRTSGTILIFPSNTGYHIETHFVLRPTVQSFRRAAPCFPSQKQALGKETPVSYKLPKLRPIHPQSVSLLPLPLESIFTKHANHASRQQSLLNNIQTAKPSNHVRGVKLNDPSVVGRHTLL